MALCYFQSLIHFLSADFDSEVNHFRQDCRQFSAGVNFRSFGRRETRRESGDVDHVITVDDPFVLFSIADIFSVCRV